MNGKEKALLLIFIFRNVIAMAELKLFAVLLISYLLWKFLRERKGKGDIEWK